MERKKQKTKTTWGNVFSKQCIPSGSCSIYSILCLCACQMCSDLCLCPLYGKETNPLGKVFSNNLFQAGPVYRYSFISMDVSDGAGCSVYFSGTPLLLSSNIKYQLTAPVQTVSFPNPDHQLIMSRNGG